MPASPNCGSWVPCMNARRSWRACRTRSWRSRAATAPQRPPCTRRCRSALRATTSCTCPRRHRPRPPGRLCAALLGAAFEVKSFNLVSVQNHDPGLFRVGGIDQHCLGHGIYLRGARRIFDPGAGCGRARPRHHVRYGRETSRRSGSMSEQRRRCPWVLVL